MMDKTQRAAAFPPGFGAARPRGTVEMDLGAVPTSRPFFSTAPRAPIRGEGGKKALMVENGANGNNASGRETAGIASYRPHPACEGSGSILGGGQGAASCGDGCAGPGWGAHADPAVLRSPPMCAQHRGRLDGCVLSPGLWLNWAAGGGFGFPECGPWGGQPFF